MLDQDYDYSLPAYCLRHDAADRWDCWQCCFTAYGRDCYNVPIILPGRTNPWPDYDVSHEDLTDDED